jgi:putative ABC transport system permease protein
LHERLRDVRYAARVLRRAPTFTIVAILTLALGVGATTTMFGVVNVVALQALPFVRAGRLVRMFAVHGGRVVGGPSALDVRDVARDAHSFERLVAYDQWRKNVAAVGSGDRPEQMVIDLVPGDYFRVLGIAPVMGRLFTEDENRYGSHYVAAISARLWRDRFGGARGVLGRAIRINDEPYTIVAVMPDAIPAWLEQRGAPVMIWTPFAISPTMWAEASRGERNFTAIGRLRDGVSIEQANADVARIAGRLASDYPADRQFGLTLAPLADTRSGSLGPILVILFAAVVFVLVIACANLANLLLARHATRHRELILRTALGAGRRRLASQLIVESLTIALAGGVAGSMLSVAATAAIARWHPTAYPQLATLAVEPGVLVFGLGIALVTGLAFGVGPAWSASRVDLAPALRSGGRSHSASARQQRTRSTLVVAEIALAVVLVTATALLAQSVRGLERQDFGFSTHGRYRAHVFLPRTRYDGAGIARFTAQFGAAVRALPGVRAATVSIGYLPTNARWVQPIAIDGAGASDERDLPTTFLTVGDDWYLRTMGIPLKEGRDLAPTDLAGRPPVALVNASFVRRYLNGQRPIGQRVRVGAVSDSMPVPPVVTIVGVFQDAKNDGLAAPPQPQLVALGRQLPQFDIAFKDIVIATNAGRHTIEAGLRTTLASIDPDLPLAELSSLDDVVAEALGGLRYTAGLLATFALLGLALAAVGTYGIVAYGVTQRTTEIGVRMATGASPSRILWLIVRQGLRLGMLGSAAGAAGALLAGGALAGQVYGLSPFDPLTIGGVAGFLILTSAVASAIPAVRASRINPVEAMRAS